MKLLITCFEGTAPILANELKILGYKTYDNFQNGMYLEGNEKDIWNINLNSRIANKIFLEVGNKSSVNDFDDLFDFAYGINWQNYIGKGHKIEINVNIFNSDIDSKKHAQSIVNKAILKKLLGEKKQRSSDPNMDTIDILLQIFENKCTIYVNTSGGGLHNRGYRTQTGEAPLKENLASSLIRLCNGHYKTPLLDPMCGSGTICIEAAMIAKNIAPGLKRRFAFEYFEGFDKEGFEAMRQNLKSKIFEGKYEIIGQDINPKMIEIAKLNAKNAGVDDIVKFGQGNILNTKHRSGYIITNPPYGKRLKSYNFDGLYKKLISLYKGNLGCFISSYGNVDKMVGYDFKIKNLNNNGEAVKVYLKK